MRLKVIGSSSAGNSYLLISGHDTLLIECGVHIRKIKEAMNFQVSNVNAIVTHCHGDHAKSIKDVLAAGIPVYASPETLLATGATDHHRAKGILPNRSCQIGSFKVKAFKVNHDVPCYGYLIEHEECGRVVFLTDTSYCNYTFPGLNNMIVEANHDLEIMETNGTPGFLRDRIIGSHMNLDTCKELLLANDLSKVNNIVLIHLSSSNSDSRRFKKEVESITGKSVFIADSGLEISFNKDPFQ